MQLIHVYCTDYVLNNMGFLRRILLDTLMQIFSVLRLIDSRLDCYTDQLPYNIMNYN